jgi:hypothetical protein
MMPKNLHSNLIKVEESKQGVATNLMIPWYAFALYDLSRTSILYHWYDSRGNN